MRVTTMSEPGPLTAAGGIALYKLGTFIVRWLEIGDRIEWSLSAQWMPGQVGATFEWHAKFRNVMVCLFRCLGCVKW
ncbi:hypothetical protein D3C77_547730 [compost metagenome]